LAEIFLAEFDFLDLFSSNNWNKSNQSNNNNNISGNWSPYSIALFFYPLPSLDLPSVGIRTGLEFHPSNP